MKMQTKNIIKLTTQYIYPQGEIPMKLSTPLPPLAKLKTTIIDKTKNIFINFFIGYYILSIS